MSRASHAGGLGFQTGMPAKGAQTEKKWLAQGNGVVVVLLYLMLFRRAKDLRLFL